MAGLPDFLGPVPGLSRHRYVGQIPFVGVRNRYANGIGAANAGYALNRQPHKSGSAYPCPSARLWIQGLLDRKSVVEGKSGSVRVDLGGRRIIKKNIEKKETTTDKS